MIRFLIGGAMGITLATDNPETGAAALLFMLALAVAFCMLEQEACRRDSRSKNRDATPYRAGKPAKPKPGKS